MMPTARTLATLRADGWMAEVVERWNPHARIRHDLFNIADILTGVMRWGETTSLGLRVELQHGTGMLTLNYSEAVDGKRQEQVDPTDTAVHDTRHGTTRDVQRRGVSEPAVGHVRSDAAVPGQLKLPTTKQGGGAVVGDAAASQQGIIRPHKHTPLAIDRP